MITKPRTATISFVRSGVRSESRLNAPRLGRLSASPRGRQGGSGASVSRMSGSDMVATTGYDGSRSTYPTPRRVWISRGSLVSTLRRSTET